MRKKKIDLAFYRQNLKTIIVDSGAHTFFSELQGEGLSVSVHTKKTRTKETPEEYWEMYKKWLMENYKYFDYFVELDIGEIVGQNTVLKWRGEIKKLGLYHKCITCYHPRVVSWKAWEEMLNDSESKYVAVEGERPGRNSLPYGRLLKAAYDRNIKVHGFALIKRRLLEKYPFYSADSSSWLAGGQYGAMLSVTKKGTKTIKIKSKDVLKIKHSGLDKLLDKKSLMIKSMEVSAMAYNKYEDYLNKLWSLRGITYEDNN